MAENMKGATDHKQVDAVAKINKYLATPDLRTVNNSNSKKA
jgi:hypothetical protein